MSLPARSETCWSATALVRVNRGSMCTTFVPRALASITHWNPDRMSLGHIAAHDDDEVRIDEVLLIGRRPAATEGGPQTGNR